MIYLAECLRYFSKFQLYQEAYDLLTRSAHSIFIHSHLIQRPYLEIPFFHGFAGFIALRIWEKLSLENEVNEYTTCGSSGDILSSLPASQSFGGASKYRKRALDHYSVYLRTGGERSKHLFPASSPLHFSPFVEYENVFLFDCDLLNLIHSSTEEDLLILS